MLPSRASEAQYRAAAKRLHHEDGVLEVDEDAAVSTNESGEDGAYVACWLWVSDEEAKR